MFSHLSVGSNDIQKAKLFYDAVLKCIDLPCIWSSAEAVGYGEMKGTQFWAVNPINGEPATVGNGQMTAFLAKTRAAVDAFYAAAMARGGSDEGPPGLRPQYHPNYYGAYVRDLEGNKLCCVCHFPEED